MPSHFIGTDKDLGVNQDQLWSISPINFDIQSQANINSLKKNRDHDEQIGYNQDSNNNTNTNTNNNNNNNNNPIADNSYVNYTNTSVPNVKNNYGTSTGETVYSIFERLRHFLYINLLLNKYTVTFSILGYFADLLLYISLNLYLFTSKNFLYDSKCNIQNLSLIVEDSSNIVLLNQTNHTLKNSSELIRIERNSNLFREQDNSTKHQSIENNFESNKSIKQSYLTLQILVVFIFFICFILSYLIKLQFKYHRWAISLYDYDIETINQQDRDGIDSLASTTTASHFSSSKNKKLKSLVKRFLNRLFTKIASILLNFLFGYQFCQNCFIEEPSQLVREGYSIFIHIFISISVLIRCVVKLFTKKNSINYTNNLKKLQEKAMYDPKSNLNKNYYFNYYTYLMRYNQNQCNQLRQHQNNQNTFRIFQLDDVSLFVGFIFSLFHLFLFHKSIELIFVFIPLLLTLILLRVKSILNATTNLLIIFFSILLISKSNSFNSIREIGSYIAEMTNNTGFALNFDQKILSNNMFVVNICTESSHIENERNKSSIINLFSYNLFTFLSFLLTFYFKSLMSIYYCTLNSLERWNISFLCNLTFWRKLSIYISYFVYVLFVLTCTITLCIRFKSWSFLVLPIYFLFALVWCSFQLLNMINLTHLMNKISDCFLLLNESNSISNANSFENSSNISKKSKSSHHLTNNRDSTLTQSSSSHNNSNQNNNNANINNNLQSSKFKFTKYLSRFLSYHKLNVNNQYLDSNSNSNLANSINIPIHRILAYKGVRNLGSISYRITLYCFAQTLLLIPFAYCTNSPLTIGLYLITLSINFIWLSLLFLFPKSSSGSCIAYALVAPPLILNIYNAGTLGNTISTCATNPTLSNISKKSKTTSSSSSTYTSSSSGVATTNRNPFMFLPFNYQQALTQRCTYILNKFQAFLQFHMIENYGCDFASTGLNKESLELKIKSYFQKKSNDGSFYNTYMLYYCGPTSALTDSMSFIDGNELSIEEIIDIWKEIHINSNLSQVKVETINNIQDLNSLNKANTHKISTKNSRLIIVLDAENTSKSLQYIKTKLNESNVYVALQTVKYNYNNTNRMNLSKISKNSETKLILGDKKIKHKTMAPGSPQVINESFFDSYLNIGKFTLDWIKSNCNSISLTNQDLDNLNRIEDYFMQNKNDFDEHKEHLYDKESEEDDDYDDDDEGDGEDDDDDENDNDSAEYETPKDNRTIKKNKRNETSSFFYEAKCAFSRHWIDYTFDSNDSTLANDLNQFWNLYYPYVICRPMLKLINCRMFYLKFDFVNKLFSFLRQLKNKIIPVHEYDTGHGFKLFTS